VADARTEIEVRRPFVAQSRLRRREQPRSVTPPRLRRIDDGRHDPADIAQGGHIGVRGERAVASCQREAARSARRAQHDPVPRPPVRIVVHVLPPEALR